MKTLEQIFSPEVVRLESTLLMAARRYLEDKGYTEVNVPRMVSATGACENIDTLFEVSSPNIDAFPKRVYLAQTGQLYLESFVPDLEKVYCIGPSFRAEPKVDERHLWEFTMLEIELKTDFEGLLREIEGIFQAMVLGLLGKKRLEAKFGLSRNHVRALERNLPPFRKLSYTQAIEILQQFVPIRWGDDIKTVCEQKLIDYFEGKPLFITHFPNPQWDHGREIQVEKFFNMIPDPENPEVVLSADLILPYGGEAVGAAARVYDAKMLEERLRRSRMFNRLVEKGGSLEDFRWYIEKTKERAVPHAGCGIGLARVIQWIYQRDDIRNCCTFSRVL